MGAPRAAALRSSSLGETKKSWSPTRILAGVSIDGIFPHLISQPSLMMKTFLALAILGCALATPVDNVVQLIAHDKYLTTFNKFLVSILITVTQTILHGVSDGMF